MRITRLTVFGTALSTLTLASCSEENTINTSGTVSQVSSSESTALTVAETRLAEHLARQTGDIDVTVDIDFKDIDRALLKASTPYPRFEAWGYEEGTHISPADGTPTEVQEIERHNQRLRQAIQARRELKIALQHEQAAVEASHYGWLLPVDYLGGRLTLTLTQDQVSEVLHRDRTHSAISDVRLHGSDELDQGFSSAIDSVEIGTVAFPAGDDGDGIGIWWNDGPDADFAFAFPGPGCALGDYTRQDPGETVTTHATYTFCTMREASPEAHIHVAEPTQACNLRNDVSTFSNPPVYVSTLSDSYNDPWDNDYHDCERDWDNFVDDTRIAHFALTQNEATTGNGYVRGSAQAANVFGIGSYDDGATPDGMSTFSNWRDPETGANKPELVGPGEINLPTFGDPWDSGTSYATPIVAGFASNLMEGRSHLYYRPHLLKAQLISSAISIESSTSKDGLGRPDYSDADSAGHWNFYETTDAGMFTGDYDSDGKPDRTRAYSNLQNGETYVAAISWLVDGTYVRSNLTSNIKVRLIVQMPNGTTLEQYGADENYQRIVFTAPQTGTYNVIMEREANPNTDDIALGLYLNWN